MTKLYVYPESLREKASDPFKNYPHVSFEIIQRKLPENAKVHLYVPMGFSVPDAASYGNTDLGVFASGNFEDGKNELTEAQMDAAANMTVEKVMQEFGAGGIAAERIIAEGKAINPNTALQFNSVAVRSFNFTFKMVAESPNDTRNIHLIENLFRKALYPKNLGVFLEYPPTFKIRFYHGDQENKYMPKILESYLVNLSTTFNASSNMNFADGSPSEIDMSLTFTETKSITREDLYETEGNTELLENSEEFGLGSLESELQQASNRITNRINQAASNFRDRIEGGKKDIKGLKNNIDNLRDLF